MDALSFFAFVLYIHFYCFDVISDTTSSRPKNVPITAYSANIKWLFSAFQLAAAEGLNDSGRDTMVQEDDTGSVIIQAEQLRGLSRMEAYQAWLIEEGESWHSPLK